MDVVRDRSSVEVEVKISVAFVFHDLMDAGFERTATVRAGSPKADASGRKWFIRSDAVGYVPAILVGQEAQNGAGVERHAAVRHVEVAWQTPAVCGLQEARQEADPGPEGTQVPGLT